MTREEITIPRWLLERIEDTLRIQYNINLDKKTGETCQDRNIKESLNGVRKLLKGEELTGGERLERLQPSLPSNLDEAARRYAIPPYMIDIDESHLDEYPYSKETEIAFKAGAEWMAEQGEVFEGVFKAGDPGYPDFHMGEQYSIEYIERKPKGVEPGDEVIVQIRKK